MQMARFNDIIVLENQRYNLVLSAFEQPTTQVAGCFVVGEHQACLSAPPQQSNRVIAQQSVVQRQRPRGSAQDARVQMSCKWGQSGACSSYAECSRHSIQPGWINLVAPLLASSLANPHSRISRIPYLWYTCKRDYQKNDKAPHPVASFLLYRKAIGWFTAKADQPRIPWNDGSILVYHIIR